MLRQARLIMTLHASTPVILALHPALELRSAGCGFQARHCHPGSSRGHPLRGLFGVSSSLPEPQLVTPQHTAPTENIGYEIPSGMIEQLLANPYAGDGTEHPDMHLIYEIGRAHV